MKVSQQKLIDLLVGMGVSTAPDWADTPGKLASKVNNAEGGITKYADPAAAYNGDPELLKLYNELAEAQAAGETIEIEAEAPGSEPKPKPTQPKKTGGKTVAAKTAPAAPKKAPAKAGAGKAGGTKSPAAPKAPKAKKVRTDGRPAPDAPYAEWKKYREKHPLEITDKGPGVMKTVVDELKAAGKGKKPTPRTKKYILGVLKEKFPGRDEMKMLTNLNNVLPGRLKREYGIHVWKDKTDSGETGYYIKGDGKTPQSKA